MRSRSAIFALILATCAPFFTILYSTIAGAASPQTPEFPYQATVTPSEVFVRGGPGDDYYPTSKLSRGDTVEVYRHDPGGWYAIRPPDGSFAWVSADFVEQSDGAHGVVKGNRVLARVGTEFSDARDIIQVRLNDGEQVEIIEAQRTGAGAETKTWYKISPPAGEFRWIPGRYVTAGNVAKDAKNDAGADAHDPDDAPDRPRTISRASRARRASLATQRRLAKLGKPLGDEDTSEADTPETSDMDDESVEKGSNGTVTANSASAGHWRRRARSSVSDVLDDESDESSHNKSGDRLDEEADFQADHVAQGTSPVKKRRAKRDSKRDDTTTAGPPRNLADIELALAETVSREHDDRELDRLRQDADSLLDSLTSEQARRQVKGLLRRIGRFEEIHERARSIADDRDGSGGGDFDDNASERSLADRRKTRSTTRDFESEIANSRSVHVAPRYEERGVLEEVGESEVGSPRFALVDEEGEITSYLTPAPGVDLTRYVGREVGVSGTRGYLPDRQAHHVVARQVTRL